MTKRGSRRRGNRKRQNNASRMEVVMGSEIELVSGASGTLTTVPLVPATFTRALAIADTFAFYRFKRVKVTIHPNVYEAIDIQGQLTAGYLAGVAPDTPPASDNDVYNLTRHIKHGYGRNLPTTMVLEPRDLIGNVQLKWFKTIAGTPDAQFEIQGNVFFWSVARGASSASIQSWNVTFDYTLELQSFVPTTSTPFIRFMHSTPEEKQKSLSVLGGKTYLELDPDMLRVLKITN